MQYEAQLALLKLQAYLDGAKESEEEFLQDPGPLKDDRYMLGYIAATRNIRKFVESIMPEKDTGSSVL
jgi:hypothetical protein